MENIMQKKPIHNCTSCAMCSAVCPTNAIVMGLSDEGFYTPFVDSKRCVQCGKCTRFCYKFDIDYEFKVKEDTEILCYSAKNLNRKELLSSSSGAVSIELMRVCIDKGYKVVGVSYDSKEERAVTKIASSKKELEQFKGSKYFQSYTEEAFKFIARDKSNQKYAIFGTPCQIYAFSKYAELTNTKEKFLLVDFFCHGCPSFTLWKKYLEEKKKEYKVSKFDEIRFRSKKYGWHEYCFDFIKDKKINTSSKYDDHFYDMFFSNDILNEACYDCIARGSIEKTDIRLGDFWGKRYDLDNDGVSAIVICSNLGSNIFNEVKDNFKYQKVSFKEIISEQSYRIKYDVTSDRRKKSLEILNSKKDLIQIIKSHNKIVSKKQRVKKYIKRILKHLPQSFYIEMRYLFHNKI